jgi:hypothetical protein
LSMRCWTRCQRMRWQPCSSLPRSRLVHLGKPSPIQGYVLRLAARQGACPHARHPSPEIPSWMWPGLGAPCAMPLETASHVALHFPIAACI